MIAERAAGGPWAASLLAAALLVGPAAAQQPRPADTGWAAVGRVNIGGYNRLSRCTGVLIAPDRVVTAAHCLLEGPDKKLVSADRVHFLAGAKRGAHQGHGRAACLRLLPGARRGGALDPSRDAAVILLRAPLDVAPLPVAGRPDARTMTVAGYSRERPHMISVRQRCRNRAPAGSMVRLDCRVSPGDSGAPLVLGAGPERAVAGLVVGYSFEESATYGVSAATWADFARSATCGDGAS